MDTYAIIEAGVVTNVFLGRWCRLGSAEGSTALVLPDGSQVSIGYTYDGHTFDPPIGGS